MDENSKKLGRVGIFCIAVESLVVPGVVQAEFYQLNPQSCPRAFLSQCTDKPESPQPNHPKQLKSPTVTVSSSATQSFNGISVGDSIPAYGNSSTLVTS